MAKNYKKKKSFGVEYKVKGEWQDAGEWKKKKGFTNWSDYSRVMQECENSLVVIKKPTDAQTNPGQ